MSIQQEKAITGVKDSQLLKRLLSYTKPYWKMVLLSIGLAFLIVVAILARPYIIKVAIDKYIGGLHHPMLAVSADREELLKPYGDLLHSGDGLSYVRLNSGGKQPETDQAYAHKQIVGIDGKEYLIDGWLPASKNSPQLKSSNGTVQIALDGQLFPAVQLNKEEIAGFRKHDISGLTSLGLIFLIAVLCGATLNYLQSNLLQYTGQNIIFNIRQQLFHHLSRLSMSYFDRNPVGRLVVRVTSDTESLNQLYSQVVVQMVKDVITLIGIVVIMVQMSFKLSLLAFMVIPLLALCTMWYKNLMRDAQRWSRLVLSRLNAFLAENLSGMRITQLFIREQQQCDQFNELNNEYYRAGMRGTVIGSIFQPTIAFIGNLAVALLLWYGGHQVLQGAATFGVVYAFTHYIRQFFNPLSSLSEKYNQIQNAMVGAERIFELLDEKPAIADPSAPKRLPKYVKGEIEFQNVWFAYNEDEWVLKDVSFKIEPGQTIAFVGATGAGKSSIIQLINRFYDIQKGSITLDGIDIRELALDDLRHYISIVQQDVFLFTGDIASNIRLSEPGITDEQVREAARMVHMDHFIRSLPEGYATTLGERGVNLSLGQRQLLSFARAIVFRPQILILDEATSNIDTETEQVVQEALQNISAGRTTLVVAHRLSTIQHADQIIVMHKGKVREIGNHYQLLAQKGYYHRLFELQYKDERKMRKAR
jgi:ATP-binding cassette subfamily B protein